MSPRRLACSSVLLSTTAPLRSLQLAICVFALHSHDFQLPRHLDLPMEFPTLAFWALTRSSSLLSRSLLSAFAFLVCFSSFYLTRTLSIRFSRNRKRAFLKPKTFFWSRNLRDARSLAIYVWFSYFLKLRNGAEALIIRRIRVVMKGRRNQTKNAQNITFAISGWKKTRAKSRLVLKNLFLFEFRKLSKSKSQTRSLFFMKNELLARLLPLKKHLNQKGKKLSENPTFNRKRGWDSTNMLFSTFLSLKMVEKGGIYLGSEPDVT